MYLTETMNIISWTLLLALCSGILTDISGAYEDVLGWSQVSANKCSEATVYPNTILNETAVEGYAIFTCESGFEMNMKLSNHGDAVLAACNETSGKWEFVDQSPDCKRISCQSPPLPAHGEFSDVRGFGEVGNYTCGQEYIVDGEDMATCLADGSWSSKPPRCRVSCPQTNDSLANAYLSDGSCFDVHSTETSWNGADDTCVSLNGSLAVITTNETFTLLQETVSNVTGDYSRGYWIGGYEKPANYSWKWHASGDLIINYFWAESEPTSGEKDTRILLSKPSGFEWTAYGYDQNRDDNDEGNGYVCQFNSSCTEASMNTGAEYNYNGACYYFQNEGFFTWESANRVDGDSGKAGCPGLGNRRGFLAEIRDQDTQDAIVSKIQTLGTSRSYWIGAERVESSDDRVWLWVDGSTVMDTWWGPDEPSTPAEKCIDLLKFGGRYMMNDELCTNSHRFICQFSATNSTTVCGDPGIPYRGNRDDVNSSPFLPGESIEFSCNDGYSIEGAANITCQTDGTWNALLPSCNAVDCGSAPTVGNATLLFHTSTEYRGTAVYGCKEGYELVGNPTIYCEMNGNWSNVWFSCQELAITTTAVETTQVPTTEMDQTTANLDSTTLQDMTTTEHTTTLKMTTPGYTTSLAMTTIGSDISTTALDATTTPATTEMSTTEDTATTISTTEGNPTTTISTTEVTTTIPTVSPTEMTTSSGGSTSNGDITTLPQTTGSKTTLPNISTVGSSTVTGTTVPSVSTDSSVPLTDQDVLTEMATSLPGLSTSLPTTQMTTSPKVPLTTTADVTSRSTTFGPTTTITSESVETTTSELSTPPSSTTAPVTTAPFTTSKVSTPITTDSSEITAMTTTKSSTEHLTFGHTKTMTTESSTPPSGFPTHRMSTPASDGSVGTTRSESPSFTTLQSPVEPNRTTSVSSRTSHTAEPTQTNAVSSRTTSPTEPTRTNSASSRTTSPAEPTRTWSVSTTEESEGEEPFPVALVASLSAIFGLLLIIILLICVVVVTSSSNNKTSNSHTLLMTDFGPAPSSPDAKASNDYITSYEAMVNSVFANEEYRKNILNYRPSVPRISSTTSRSHSQNGWSSPQTGVEGAVGSESGSSEPIYARVYKDRELSVVRFPSTFEERLAEKGLVSFDPSKRNDLTPSDLMGAREMVFEGTE